MIQIGDMKMYNVQELAGLFQVHEKTARKLINEGILKGKKLAKKWYVPEAQIVAYFNANQGNQAG